MALLDLAQMQRKCREGQWSLEDIHWDAPGRELVTADDSRRMRRFMTDLVWIESFGQAVFEAMAKKTRDPQLREIYEGFALDELRHADAEQRLMLRWGMIDRDERPAPNPSARIAIEFLKERGHEIPFAVYATVLPMFEIALDGALLKFLNGSVKDPVCRQVFENVNRDEARHLAVDFHTLEVLGGRGGFASAWKAVGALLRPSALHMLVLGYIPLLERAWRELGHMGVPASDLMACMRKFRDLGARNSLVARLPIYRIVASHGAAFSHPDNAYHWIAGALVWLTDFLEAADSWNPSWSPVRLMPRAA